MAWNIGAAQNGGWDIGSAQISSKNDGGVFGTITMDAELNASQIYDAEVNGSINLNAELNGAQKYFGEAKGTINLDSKYAGSQVYTGIKQSTVNMDARYNGGQAYIGIKQGTINLNSSYNASQKNSGTAQGAINLNALHSGGQKYSGITQGVINLNAVYNALQKYIGSKQGTINLDAKLNVTQKYSGIKQGTINMNAGYIGIIAPKNAASLNSSINMNASYSGVQRIIGLLNSSISMNANYQGSTLQILGTKGGTIFIRSMVSEKESVMSYFGFNGEQIPECRIKNFNYSDCALPIVKITKDDMAQGNIKLDIPNLSSSFSIITEVYEAQEDVNDRGYWSTISQNIYSPEIVNIVNNNTSLDYAFDPSALEIGEDQNKYYVVFIYINEADDASIIQGAIKFVINIQDNL